MPAEVTDWISAGANVAAAIGTVGALWVGALTLRRQVNDQHRAQASAVTVGNRPWKEWHPDVGELKSGTMYFISNNSSLPIYYVLLYTGSKETRRKEDRAVLAPGEELSFRASSSDSLAFAKFVDSAGVPWTRNGAGALTQVKGKDFLPWPVR